MDWKTVASAVANSAPILGAVLGGPAGAVAGAAGSILASTLGVEADPSAVLRKLNDPQSAERLRELEVRERSRLLQWQEKQLEAELANTQGARAREVALARAGHGGAWVTGLVALVVVVGFFWMLMMVLEQPRISEPALLLLGSLGTAFGSVVNYYLGSSLGSLRKNAFIAPASQAAARGEKA